MSIPPITPAAINHPPGSAFQLTIEEILDSQPISPRQIMIVCLCFGVSAFDGLDIAIMGFLAPAIRAEWHILPAELALLFSGGLAGLTVGALIAGPLADIIGRKRVLLIAVATFGLMCVASAFSRNHIDLFILRVLTGFGLGAAAPNAITLTSEYCPARKRSLLVTAMFCGFTLGSALGGTLVVPLLLPHVGWRGVFVFIGALPLILVPFLAALLPESLKYLTNHGATQEEIDPVLHKVFPGLPADTQAVIVPEKTGSKAMPLSYLFKGVMRIYTPVLWAVYFLNLLVVYLFSNWLPIVITDSGMPVSEAVVVVGIFQIGGTLGGVALGYLMDRRKAESVLSISFLIGAVAIAALGFVYFSQYLLAACMFVAGACISGAMTGANAMTSQIYPTASRATGVGWALGIGRFGSIIGSAAGAWLFSKKFNIQTSFLVVSVPVVFISLALAWLGRIRQTAEPVG